jgi:enediyne biosynthesis protein E4
LTGPISPTSTTDSPARPGRDAIGARVEVEVGGRVIVRQRKGGASLGSAHDPRLLIGIGPEGSARRVTIRWPSGHVDQYLDLAANTSYVVREGATRVQSLSSHRRKEANPP